MTASLHVFCPRCKKGLGFIRANGLRVKKSCKKCLDRLRVTAEPRDDGNYDVTWELLWSKHVGAVAR